LAILSISGVLHVAEDLISVVDDDEAIRRTTELLLESFGFRTAVFDSAESYLSSGLLRETACLVVDIKMPGMDGLELQSRIAAGGSSVLRSHMR
jgi:FixJ family two-component response regulator